jgi:uncharacterized protein YihD (DUF1040 family)
MKQEIIQLLLQRWRERPEASLAAILTSFCYQAEGHTDLVFLEDEKLLEELKKGFRKL